MDPREAIEAQFKRAVEIVQGLSKTGPIQTGYEEKLTMYSLYKQATVGNVKPPRPGIWDALGRAKWDAWAKHKDLEPLEAKWMYIQALMKVLRKYSDKTMARQLIDELEASGGSSSNLLLSGHLSRGSSSASGSTGSDIPLPRPDNLPFTHLQAGPAALPGVIPDDEEATSTSEDESDDEDREHPAMLIGHHDYQASLNRPESSLSNQRYRTPLATSLASPAPPLISSYATDVPATQPRPGFETPSAFGEAQPYGSASQASSFITPTTHSASYMHPSQVGPSGAMTPSYPYRAPLAQTPNTMRSGYGVPIRPASRPQLERALESVQGHLAALTERVEALELHATSRSVRSSPTHNYRSGDDLVEWNLDDLGMWTVVVRPVSRLFGLMKVLTIHFINGDIRSPLLAVLRRLCLDLSFLLAALGLFRYIWRRSGIRRREVKLALGVLWKAIMGRHGTSMQDVRLLKTSSSNTSR